MKNLDILGGKIIWGGEGVCDFRIEMKGTWFTVFFYLLFHLKSIHPNLLSILKHPMHQIPPYGVGNIPGSAAAESALLHGTVCSIV